MWKKYAPLIPVYFVFRKPHSTHVVLTRRSKRHRFSIPEIHSNIDINASPASVCSPSWNLWCFEWRGLLNPILTGPSTSNILTWGASQALHLSSKMATTKCQNLIYYWYINHFSPFKPLSSLLLRFFKKCVIEIQKIDHFWKFFSKKSKIEFDTSKWRARWVDYDYGRFFTLRQLFGALLVDFLVRVWGAYQALHVYKGESPYIYCRAYSDTDQKIDQKCPKKLS